MLLFTEPFALVSHRNHTPSNETYHTCGSSQPESLLVQVRAHQDLITIPLAGMSHSDLVFVVALLQFLIVVSVRQTVCKRLRKRFSF